MVPCSQAGAKISRYGRRGGCSLARGHESALHSRIVNFNSLFGSGIALGVVANLAAVVAASIAIGVIGRLIVRRIVSRIVRRTPYKWDELMYRRGIFSSAMRFVPPLLIFLSLPVVLADTPVLHEPLRRITTVWMIAVGIRILSAIGSFIDDLYRVESEEMARHRPIKGYVQLAKIFIYVVGMVLMVTTLIGVSPLGILGGLGALSAVLLLVFRDAILGFVSAVQLSANHMVSIGDWIEVPKYGADGPVIDITLQTIKVRNWDMTITSLPSYVLISDSFKNWRGIYEAGGRRIKRSINLDVRSVCFCTPEMIERFRRMPLIAEYMERKLTEIGRESTDEDMTVGRHLTNLGTFRAYALAYMNQHPGVQQNLIQMVRQLQPGPHGLPLEIYCFTRETAWIGHEAVQSDMFDHLLAVLPEFYLRAYQQPSGWDLRELSGFAGPPGRIQHPTESRRP